MPPDRLDRPYVLVVTDIPSPYQVELFNALTTNRQVELSVLYVRRQDALRYWQRPGIAHECRFVDEFKSGWSSLFDWIEFADLAVFSHYQTPAVLRLIERRHQCLRPWCFWGERPGARGLGVLGRLFRRWKLATLHQTSVPIWGIGDWAVAGYQREFGNERSYFNIPYYSDLRRFTEVQRPRYARDTRRRFLYSGSLIERKGVDLLADAFTRIAQTMPTIELDIVGDGKLRPTLERCLGNYRSHVRFHGFQRWDALARFYADADVLCVPSRYDGWGLVVPEGLAAGMPVITTDRTGAAHDLIKPGKNGWLIKANDGEALYHALCDAANLSSAEMDEYSKSARESVTEHALTHGAARFASAVRATLDAWRTYESLASQGQALTGSR